MNEDIIAFIEGGVAIVIASRSATLEPSLARASGCRVDSAGHRLRVFCSQRASARLIEDVRAGAPIAATFSRPSTHRSLQLKAASARLARLEPQDWPALERECEAFAQDVSAHGHSPEFVKTVLSLAADDAVAIEFWPDEAFEQTPGRNAGELLPVK